MCALPFVFVMCALPRSGIRAVVLPQAELFCPPEGPRGPVIPSHPPWPRSSEARLLQLNSPRELLRMLHGGTGVLGPCVMAGFES